jgi:hypothetical protein
MFERGDLLFTQLGPIENAISAVTEGYRGARVNHMGVVLRNNKGLFFLEAFPPEVRITQVDFFLRRSEDLESRPRYICARLKKENDTLIPRAIEYGLSKRNIPYDALYLTDEAFLYCSELVVDMFRSANNGMPFFFERPMSFRDLIAGEIHPAWVEYYSKFGMEVPQGEPGSNPGDISKDIRLSIVHVEGDITGYNNH